MWDERREESKELEFTPGDYSIFEGLVEKYYKIDMKMLLLTVSIILFLVLAGVTGYGIYRKGIEKKWASEYEKLVQETLEKYKEDGLAAIALIEKAETLKELGRHEETIQAIRKLLQMAVCFKLNRDAIWRMAEYYTTSGESQDVIQEKLTEELIGIYRNTKDPRTKLEAIYSIINFYWENEELDKAVKLWEQVENSIL